MTAINVVGEGEVEKLDCPVPVVTVASAAGLASPRRQRRQCFWINNNKGNNDDTHAHNNHIVNI
jgi:hypothetical protein